MVFYFTATGNSLYVAKQLDAQPISIPQVIHRESLIFQDETIGIVCPVFGHEVPIMVQEFLKNARFKTDYFYMILTYGKRHGGAAELAQDRLRSCGITPAYINTFLMVDNFLPVFDMKEEILLDKNVEGQLAAIKKDIAQRRHFISPVTDEDRATHQEFLSRSNTPPEERWRSIYQVTSACVGCGICQKVCPSGCWKVSGGTAQYHPEGCQSCMACIHACPQKAIQMTIPEKNPNARYRNEHISLQEIIQANLQKA